MMNREELISLIRAFVVRLKDHQILWNTMMNRERLLMLRAITQYDQGLRCPLKGSLDFVEYNDELRRADQAANNCAV